jgi:hypothetical protein
MVKIMQRNTYQCNALNLDGLHSYMEMALASLFDRSFSTSERVLIASNEALRYRFSKNVSGSTFTVTVLSPSKMDEIFTVEYGSGTFPITISTNKDSGFYDLLDVSRLQY